MSARPEALPSPLVALGAIVLAFALWAGELGAQEAPAGKATYDRWCAGCHGVEGDGKGPGSTAMLPRPRNFTTGRYQIRSTQSGALPTDADLLGVILDGMPGTAMPGWRDRFSDGELRDLVAYLKTFSPFFERQPPPEPVPITDAPSASEEALAEGREFYTRIECTKCHGENGRGNGPGAAAGRSPSTRAGAPIRGSAMNR